MPDDTEFSIADLPGVDTIKNGTTVEVSEEDLEMYKARTGVTFASAIKNNGTISVVGASDKSQKGGDK